MDLGLRNKVFAIVGGSTGMGYSTAEILAYEGSKCCLISRDLERAQRQAERLSRQTGAETIAISADGTTSESLDAAIDEAAQHFSKLDGIAITAGPMLEQKAFDLVTDELWLAYFQNQLMLTVRGCRAALPILIENGGGTIVTTSAYSIRAQKPTLSAYTAMKSAIASITKNIAKSYGDRGIRANCICPGAIATEALDSAATAAVEEYGEPADEALDKYMIERWGLKIALNRVGRPHEVGELIAFLLSKRAGYMTGALLNIDGGTDF